MADIVYYVASSLDGYICGEGEDISAFAQGGPCVEKYLEDLQRFETVIMGRRTYEFGYKFGLKAGQPAYPHMRHHIFSKSLQFEETGENVFVEKISIERVMEIKENATSEVYLCGGGNFAGWLLSNNLIDIVKIKLNPIVLNGGVKLFENCSERCEMNLVDHTAFEDGLQLLTYRINI